MSYVQNESISVDGIESAFTLANAYTAGTLLITYNNKLCYQWREENDDTDGVTFDFVPLATDTVYASYYTYPEPNVYNAQRYITCRQVKDSTNGTRVTNLASVADDTMEVLIREVERYIDIYCGYWEKYYDNDGDDDYQDQVLTFPRLKDYDNFDTDNDNYVGIPHQITKAALYGLENLYLKGAASEASKSLMQSESLGDYSYTNRTGIGLTDKIEDVLGTRCLLELKGFRKRTGKIDIIGNSDEGTWNSRQKFINNL